MTRELPLLQRAAIGAIVLVLFAAGAVMAVNYGLGTFDNEIRVRAELDSAAQGLAASSDVKVRGVRVGRVVSIGPLPDGRAGVEIALDSGARIGRSVVASIEPLSIFGPKFVNLVPGPDERTGPFLVDGDVITRSTATAELADVLNSANVLLDAIDPQAVVTVFTTLADSIGGLGPELRRIIDNSIPLVDLASRRMPQTEQFLSDLATVSEAFTEQMASIQATVANANLLLPVFNGNADQVGALLDGASRISGALSGYITENADSLGAFATHADHALQVAVDRLDDFPNVLEVISDFFGLLGGVVRLPGPGGEMIGAMHGGLYKNLCATIPLPVVCELVG